MTSSVPASGEPEADRARAALDSAAGRGGEVLPTELDALGALDPDTLDETFRAFATERDAEALPVLATLARESGARAVRRAARRALYRLAQRGVVPPPPAPRVVVQPRAERAVRAWLSGIDGSGSRAGWILFEDGRGGSTLCSLILSDTAGIVDAAGGAISKRRFARELAELRASQKLPWVETDPARAVGLVADALRLHEALGTAPPAAFARWRPRFEGAPPAPPPDLPAEPDPTLVERSLELLELPELAGWFLDPESVQSDALALLEARESRLVVSDAIKAEREEAIVSRVVERELDVAARHRWQRRLGEMALIFEATGRPEHARLATAGAAALERDPARHPLARALARRGLEVAAEVAGGRLAAADVSRKPAALRSPRQ